jgi:hypothetical protein
VTSRLPPIGFWSYARKDDEASRGRLSSLRSLLMSELQQQYGRDPIRIFQDVGAIPPGAEWEARIRTALDDSTFYIPIISPNFVESPWCNREFMFFLERERRLNEAHPDLKGARRVFPISYIDIRDGDPCDERLLPELRRLQWLDFKPYRLKDYNVSPVPEQLELLARSICDLLQVKVDETKSAPPSYSPAGMTAHVEDVQRSNLPSTAQHVEVSGKSLEASPPVAAAAAAAEELRVPIIQYETRKPASRKQLFDQSGDGSIDPVKILYIVTGFFILIVVIIAVLDAMSR